jgi:hypothetical protein
MPWMSRRCERRESSVDVDSIWSTTSMASGGAAGRAAPSSASRCRIAAAALDPLQREPRSLGLLQNLRHAGARQPDLGGQIFAGMKVAVGELAQQCEPKRSKH